LAGEAWVVEEEPSLEIGTQDGAAEYIFFRVAGALRLDDGRVVIADGFSNQVRFYSEAGEFLTVTSCARWRSTTRNRTRA
jgi:hypothetical protein